MSLVNKSALVTGAAGGIGSAICVELLKNGIKYLAALDLSSDEPKIVTEWRKKYPRVSIKYFKVDVTSKDELEKCYSEFTSEIPNLDIVINCAGIYNETIPKKVVEVNLMGVIQSTLIAIEYMRADKGKGKGGAILNIASITGLNPFSIAPTYSATKFGVIGYTRAVAYKRDHLGIKFLSLCPGVTDTELFHKCLNISFMSTKEKEDNVKTKLEMQRYVFNGLVSAS